MIDYRDFQQQAELDIKRSEELYKQQDYGFAAFSAQQGVEKYLKAYLMKFNLIAEPKKLGHLQYDMVLAMIIDKFTIMKEDMKDIPIFVSFFDIASNTFVRYKSLIESRKIYEDKRIISWKISLQIKLNKNEEKIVNGLETGFEEATSQLKEGIPNIMNIFSEIPSSIIATIPEDYKKFIEFSSSIPQLIESGDVFKITDEAINLVKPISYGNSPQAMSKHDTDVITSYFLLLRSFKWFDIAVSTYPHQEISRYPTEIDGVNSTLLYEQNKEALLELIQQVRNACNEIKFELNRPG